MTRVLLTGATGYVGGELLPVLLERGHDVRALTRDPSRAACPTASRSSRATSCSGTGLEEALDGIDVALYLVHSMGAGAGRVRRRRPPRREAFAQAASGRRRRRVVYLGGLQGDSEHLRSREEVADLLREHGPAARARPRGDGDRRRRRVVRDDANAGRAAAGDGLPALDRHAQPADRGRRRRARARRSGRARRRAGRTSSSAARTSSPTAR